MAGPVPTTFCIPANPDISGIGVRIAIYSQNLLAFIPVLLSLKDGFVSKDELKSIETQTIGVLIIAFAILITTIVQGTTGVLSNFQAALILNLSWMNNISTFIWFLLYVHHRTKPYKTMPVTWDDWVTLLRRKWRERKDGPVETGNSHAMPHTTWNEGTQPGECDIEDVGHEGQESAPQAGHSDPGTSIAQQSEKTAPGPIQRCILFTAKHLVLILGSLHLSLMSAVGIWLWRNPTAFGGRDSDCPVSTVLLGTSIPFDSPGLRAWSLLIYSILLVPGFNLVVPFCFFLVPHIICNQSFGETETIRRIETLKLRPFLKRNGECMRRPAWQWPLELSLIREKGPNTVIVHANMLCLIATNLIFLVDTEIMLSRNSHLQEPDEHLWEFGQVLSLVLLLVPLKDLLTSIAFVERMDSKIATRFLRESLLHNKFDLDLAKKWVIAGADVNTRVERGKYSPAHRLTLAAENIRLRNTFEYSLVPSRTGVCQIPNCHMRCRG